MGYYNGHFLIRPLVTHFGSGQGHVNNRTLWRRWGEDLSSFSKI